jgi:hypothetical protein
MSEIKFSYGGKEVKLNIDGTYVTKTFRNNDEPRILGAVTLLDNKVNNFLQQRAKDLEQTITEEFQTMDLGPFGFRSPMAGWIRERGEIQGYVIVRDDGLNIQALRIHEP